MDAIRTLGQPRALISRSALLHNVKVLRRDLPDTTRICAVIKADAYGHGASIVADALTNFSSEHIEAPAVDLLAVATIDEALALGDVSVPVMVLRPVENAYVGRERERLQEAIRRGYVLTVASAQAAGDVARIAMACNRRANVQVMLDTGVTREGASIEVMPELVGAIEAHPALRPYAIGTHFVSSEDATSSLTPDQLRRFRTASGSWTARNSNLIRHAANSGAIFFTPASHLDMVRPGLALYGIDPTCRPCVERPLRPVMKWTAPLLMIRDVAAGCPVGYGQAWRAERDARVGLVPVGYADGYVRALSNRGTMLVNGRRAPVVGRVSMDYTTIDLSNVPGVNVGDEVTVLDGDPLSPASVYRLAEQAGTIPYEILCRVGPRVTRVAVDPSDDGDADFRRRQADVHPGRSNP
jgi:alanine racemase